MSNKVRFEVDAETGKAIQQFLKVVDAQGKMTGGFEKSMKAAKGFDGVISKFATSFIGGLSGMGALETAGQIFADTMGHIRHGLAEASKFEEQMTGLLSIGDNLDNIGAVKTQVLEMAEGWGIARDQVIAAIYDLQSGTSNLSASIQKDLLVSSIELHKLTGSALPESMKAAAKGWQIYGKELSGVTELTNKLLHASDQGWVEMNELAEFFPELASRAKAAEASYDELMATIAIGTQSLGKVSPTFTSLAGVMLRMEKAEKEGVKLTGSFTDKLEQLGKAAEKNPQLLKKVFGEEHIGAAKVLIERLDELKKKVEEFQNLDRNTSFAREKLGKRLSDESYRFAEMQKSIEESRKNAPLSGEYAKNFGTEANANAMAMNVYEQALGPKTKAFFNWMMDVGTLGHGDEYKPYAMRMMLAAMGGSDLPAQMQAGKLMSQGRNVEADALVLEQGVTKFRVPKYGEIATTPEDAQRYVVEREKYGDALNLAKFLDIRQAEETLRLDKEAVFQRNQNDPNHPQKRLDRIYRELEEASRKRPAATGSPAGKPTWSASIGKDPSAEMREAAKDLRAAAKELKDASKPKQRIHNTSQGE